MAVFIVLLMGWALLNDALEGFPFTRSARSWSLWAAGLIVGGFAGIVFDGLAEWLVDWIAGGDDLSRGGWRRVERLALVIGVVAVLSAVALLVFRFAR